MKRVKSACICQTLQFIPRDMTGNGFAADSARKEAEEYIRKLQESQSKHRILEEHEEADGSYVIKLIKQYNDCPVGSYLD